MRVTKKTVKKAAVAERQAVVYWLHDDACGAPEVDGYVGVSVDWVTREKTHRRSGRFVADFKIAILFHGTLSECLAVEAGYRPNPDIGWNSHSGGLHGRIPSASTRARLSRASKGRIVSAATREKIGAGHRGGHREDLSPEARISIKQKLTGRRASEETRLKLSAARKGKKRNLSATTLQKMRERMLGNKLGLLQVVSDERRKKQSERMLGNSFNIGRKHTADARLRMSRTLKGHKKSPTWRASLSKARKTYVATNGAPKHTEETKSRQAAARRLWWQKNCGWKHSDETRRKMRAAHASRREIASCA